MGRPGIGEGPVVRVFAQKKVVRVFNFGVAKILAPSKLPDFVEFGEILLNFFFRN